MLLITFLPLLLVTLILGGHLISSRLEDANIQRQEKGLIMSQLLASSAEFGMLTGNAAALRSLITSAMKQDEVADILFLDRDYKLVQRAASSGNIPLETAKFPLIEGSLSYFRYPITTTGFDITNNPELLPEYSSPEFIGWVIVAFSNKPGQVRQQEIIIRSSVLVGIIFLLAFLLASRFGRQITRPILDLSRVIQELQRGNLEARANLKSTGELKELAHGINKLGHQVYDFTQNLEGQVDRATQRLRSTLVHLEKQNQALDTARQRADDANAAKDEFLARMSHELRTPLTSVLGFARLLDRTPLKMEQKEYTRIINLTSTLLLSIIDDILDYSKLESNAIELEQLPFNIESCILDVFEMQTVLAHDKGLELVPILQPDTPRILHGDSVRIKQVLSNLISNAVKFTAEGHIAVYVSATPLGEQQIQLRIIVRDTGSGIPEERVSHLFQAFNQADTSISRRYGGSGLGLVIAKQLTELMGGTIALSSEENQGTTVTLEIPFKVSPVQSIVTPLQVPHLIIYDHCSEVRTALKYLLETFIKKIHVAKSLEEMSKLAESLPNSSILWGLPAGDLSESTILQLGEMLQYATHPVIILSSQPMAVDLPRKVIQLRKPVRTQLLLNALSPDAQQTQEQDASNLQFSGSPRILITEDNNFNRLLICRILEKAGAKVYEAINGEEAVDKSLRLSPDLILMDVHMPKMDGIEATRQIRMRSQKKLPIVALTANIISSEHQKLLDAGVNQVLLKPINDHELFQTIEELLFPASTNNSSHEKNAQNGTKLEQYGISHSDLTHELQQQLDSLRTQFDQHDFAGMRECSHQIVGLAGLYQLPELENAGNELHEAILGQQLRTIWKKLWHMTRIIEHEQF
ncbi:ATP-binding protein [Pontibacter sp. JAM-7]|uniref:ATP-binding protein n=1 Tax=Pontibacter sp. JAM-7 TaxID=3366581 RepID=UPI003AF9EBE3